MSLVLTELSVLAYANNFTLWHYTTPDASVAGAGYFNTAASMLRVGDMIIATFDSGATPETKFYLVTANTGSAVTVTLYS
jgi:hypothetical protein